MCLRFLAIRPPRPTRKKITRCDPPKRKINTCARGFSPPARRDPPDIKPEFCLQFVATGPTRPNQTKKQHMCPQRLAARPPRATEKKTRLVHTACRNVAIRPTTNSFPRQTGACELEYNAEKYEDYCKWLKLLLVARFHSAVYVAFDCKFICTSDAEATFYCRPNCFA